MLIRIILVSIFGICLSNAAFAREERWYNFAEDGDLRYYIDERSIVTRNDDIRILWVKSVAKNREYFREEYNLNDLSYILTNYEMDCSDATYRVRQIIMMDKNRRELNKSMPAAAATNFEPIPPESALELAQDMVCAKTGTETTEEPDEVTPPSVAPAQPVAPPAEQPDAEQPQEPATGEEPSLQ